MKFGNYVGMKKGNHKKPTLFIGLPTMGMVPIEFHIAAQRLLTPINAKLESYVVKGEEVGVARNMIAKMALSRGQKAEFILFIGDDMIPNWDALVLLYEEAVRGEWDILGALYYMKQNGVVPMPILWREGIVGYLREGIHYQPGEAVVSDISGMDFTLIRTSIFEKISYPWFKTGPTKVEGIDDIWLHTEDAWFCRKAKNEANAKIGVHTGVRVGHLDIATGEVY